MKPLRSFICLLVMAIALWLLSACRASQHVAQTTEEKELHLLNESSASNSSSSSVLSFLQSYGLHIDSIVITMAPLVSGDDRLTLIEPDTLHGDGTVLPQPLSSVPTLAGAVRQSHPPNQRSSEKSSRLGSSSPPVGRVVISGITLNHTSTATSSINTAKADTTSLTSRHTATKSDAKEVTPTPPSYRWQRRCLMAAIALLAVAAIAIWLRKRNPFATLIKIIKAWL